MKASVRVNNQVVELVITFMNGYAGEWDYTFSHDCSHKAYAGLAASALSRQFHDQIERIRREAYENGWKDAKGRKAKRQHFSSSFNAP